MPTRLLQTEEGASDEAHADEEGASDTGAASDEELADEPQLELPW